MMKQSLLGLEFSNRNYLSVQMHIISRIIRWLIQSKPKSGPYCVHFEYYLFFFFTKNQDQDVHLAENLQQKIASVSQGITCCGENICKCNLFRTNCRVNFCPLFFVCWVRIFCPTFYLPGGTFFYFAQ